MPFLDTLITPQRDGTLTASVYTKSTHADLYLQWDSHNNLACKYTVINTHTHRDKAVCSNPQLLKELQHLEEVLMNCKYPKWAIDKVLQKKEDTSMRSRRNQGSRNQPNTEEVSPDLMQYSPDLCEGYKTTCSNYCVQVHFKGGGYLGKSTDAHKRQRWNNKTK